MRSDPLAHAGISLFNFFSKNSYSGAPAASIINDTFNPILGR